MDFWGLHLPRWGLRGSWSMRLSPSEFVGVDILSFIVGFGEVDSFKSLGSCEGMYFERT